MLNCNCWSSISCPHHYLEDCQCRMMVWIDQGPCYAWAELAMHIGNHPGNSSCTQSDSRRISSSSVCLSGVNTRTIQRTVSGQPTSQAPSLCTQMRWPSPWSTVMFLMPGFACSHFSLILFASNARARRHSISSAGRRY